MVDRYVRARPVTPNPADESAPRSPSDPPRWSADAVESSDVELLWSAVGSYRPARKSACKPSIGDVSEAAGAKLSASAPGLTGAANESGIGDVSALLGRTRLRQIRAAALRALDFHGADEGVLNAMIVLLAMVCARQGKISTAVARAVFAVAAPGLQVNRFSVPPAVRARLSSAESLRAERPFLS